MTALTSIFYDLKRRLTVIQTFRREFNMTHPEPLGDRLPALCDQIDALEDELAAMKSAWDQTVVTLAWTFASLVVAVIAAIWGWAV